ncbi:hypothetical protein DSCW_62160 [Desulfosarcina widdelii]|uniref:Uncharacterized protein n=1 Tax=Desulfosarcina widdelii TaxID=947919 RepID=A0A5K7ZF74_9BACT|nr:hypothetical protein DSCW_62160 [Desulfosarcina widdelii]
MLDFRLAHHFPLDSVIFIHYPPKVEPGAIGASLDPGIETGARLA